MKSELVFVVVLAVLGGLAADSAEAQRGMGQATGVAVQSVRPDVVSLAGTVQSIEIGPCERTTGRASMGAHFILKTPDAQELNVHLGPAAAVEFITDQLPVGKEVTVDAFRTAIMPDSHYVAQVVTFDGTAIRLRDENLRPAWAGGGAAMRGPGGPQPGPGWGQGPGYGRGQGPGYGRGYGRGQGAGYGRGYGGGRGWGQGPGPGNGYCPRLGPGYGRGHGRGAGWGQGAGAGGSRQ